MNKLLISSAVLSVLGLFNAYASFAQTNDKIVQTEKQSIQQEKNCNTPNKDCCKDKKAKPGNCCACCSGSNCAATDQPNCCG